MRCFVLFVVCVLVGAGLAGAEDQKQSKTVKVKVKSKVESVPPIIVRMHEECNRVRVQHGLQPLVLDVGRCGIGQRWASYLARNRVFHHGGGEQIIAMGYGSVESCMAGWLGSSGHRAWLLSNSQSCGWGAERSSDGTWYWVGVFNGSPSGGSGVRTDYRRGRFRR
jgi:uncharacterized protein YkwD